MTAAAVGARLKTDVARFPAAWVYLVVALCWGMTLVVLLPPFQNSDEPEHFFRAWAMAEGHIFPGAESLVDLPVNVGTLNADLHATEVTRGAEPYDARTTIDALADKVSAKRMLQFSSMGSYSFIGYLPQAIGIDAVRVVGGSPLLGLYAARVALLLTCVALTFLALHLAPYGAAILALVALLPMSVTLAASTNASALLNAGALLWLVLVLRFAARGRVRRRDAGYLVAVALLFLTIKPGYAPLAALVLLLSPRVFEERRGFWVTVAGCVLGAVTISALVMWSAPDVSTAREVARGAPLGVDPGEQLRFVVEHPWAFTRVAVATMGASGLTWLKEAVGILGRGAVVLPDVVTLAALAGGLLLMVRGTEEHVSLRVWQRWLLVGVAVVTSGAVVVALYVSWSPVAGPIVLGVQGRYFLPVVPSLLMGLYGWRLRSRRTVLLVLALSVAVMVAGTLYAVLSRYY